MLAVFLYLGQCLPIVVFFFLSWWSREHPKSQLSRRGATTACTCQVQAESSTSCGQWAKGQARPWVVVHVLGKQGIEKLWNLSQPTENRHLSALITCHSGSMSSSVSLPAKVSYVVKNQLHIAGLHVWVAELSALDLEHHTPPASPVGGLGCPCWGGLPPSLPAAQASQGCHVRHILPRACVNCWMLSHTLHAAPTTPRPREVSTLLGSLGNAEPLAWSGDFKSTLSSVGHALAP